MLKPLKDLLTYLQRNANSSNIFGLTTPTAASTTAAASTTMMGPNEAPRMEETIIVSEELSVVEDGGDPLYDPLALDDCPGADVVNVSGTSVGSDADDDGGVGISPDQFTLVDVSTLKPKEQQEADEPETEDDDDEEPATVVVRTVVEEKVMAEEEEQEQGPIGGLLNGSTSAALVVELETSESSSIVEGDEVTPAGECERSSPTVLDKFASVEDVIRLSSLSSSSPSLLDEAETADGETIQLIDDYVDAVATVREGGSERTATVEAVAVAAAAAEVVQTTAEQIQGTTNGEEEEEASDGSDSGLGLEPARSVAVNSSGSTSNSSSSSSSSSNNSPLQRPPPIKSSLKRRSEPPVDAGQRETEEGASSQKRPKKGITFEGVTVFYFPRIQGFGCVPSQGGCTLGMEFQHVHSRRLTLSEHSAEQRKVHRQQLQELNPRSSSSEDTSSEEEPSESGSEAESESYGFLQPVSTRQRRALLKAAGVRKIDPSEKDDCREIRTSREVCGCTCRGFCDPHRCACSLAGIKCQVDRPNFPCGCTHEGCANTAGRVEFNPGRVRTHFLHTIMKLRMEGAGEGKAVMEAAGGSSAAGGGGVSDANAGGGVGGYVIGGEKNWSNGPVRLPPSSMVVGYGTDMPASTVPDMVDGTGSNHQVPGMLPQHLPMVLLDGMHHSAAGVLQQQPQQHHLSHQSLPPYPNHLGADDGMHQNYPSATSDSLSLHYGPYRDYYGGIEGGTIGDGIHPAGMPLHHHYHHLPATTSSSSSIEPSSSSTALHTNMYYTDSYASFQAQADSSTAATHIDPYRHNPLVVGPLHHHVPSSTTAAVSRQHMLTTGHDRPTASTSYVESLRPDGEPAPPTLSLPEKGLLPQVPLQAVNGNASQTPTASSTTLVPCSEQATLDQSFRSDSEHCDPNVTVISDATTLSTIDSSGDVVTLVIPDTSRTDTCEIVDDDDGDGDGDRPKGSNLNCPSSDFIDLETPQADNAERLEAINDLLASSRNTLSIVRPSIVAEEDDELRDFQHPPPEPSESAICYEDDDDVDDGGDDDDSDDVILRGGGGGGLRVTRSAKDRDPPPRSFYGSGTLTNGTTTSKAAEQQQLHQKRTRCPTVGEECSSSHKRMLQNGSADEEVPFVSAYTADDVPAAAAVVSSSTANLLAAASVGSLSSAALEPSENLCEIIKNSIVETAVSH
uniref:CSRNP_N domain-containing protein n=1 Tax=Anopheles coluzzii TaxID=1518534 RepID=A0A6E8VXA4_ANOCL|nr:uncharacterized protein LOC120956342 [Anopheles coluzzii]XP_040233660.2 uncharacterized protein LOC120956342 [Anopheles coluzzii]XP_040233661.2 uncharacterized protein LOC120956342 [Anopheles coluzzii]